MNRHSSKVKKKNKTIAKQTLKVNWAPDKFFFKGKQNKYAIISPDTRKAFLNKVLSKQATIKEAAQEFGIKFSTSKAILQTYRKEGRIGKKKFRQRKSMAQDKTKVVLMNNLIVQRVQTMKQLEEEAPQEEQKNIHSAPTLDNVHSRDHQTIQMLLNNPILLGSLMEGVKKRQLIQQQMIMNSYLMEIAKERKQKEFLLSLLNEKEPQTQVSANKQQ